MITHDAEKGDSRDNDVVEEFVAFLRRSKSKSCSFSLGTQRLSDDRIIDEVQRGTEIGQRLLNAYKESQERRKALDSMDDTQ